MQFNSHKSGNQITLTQLGQVDGSGSQSGSMAMQQHMNPNQGVIVQNMGIGMNGSGESDRCQSLVCDSSSFRKDRRERRCLFWSDVTAVRQQSDVCNMW